MTGSDHLDHDRSSPPTSRFHTRLAAQYRDAEPHFRPENVAKVERRLLGCDPNERRGTAARSRLRHGLHDRHRQATRAEIIGVDVTPAMLERVDTAGPARISSEHDTGSFKVEEGGFDLVTAYSFLHHLSDLAPTLRTAARALQPGGQLYVDLDPNSYFWSGIDDLDRDGAYDPVVEREVARSRAKDEEIETEFGVGGEVFNLAEYGKSTAGGFFRGLDAPEARGRGIPRGGVLLRLVHRAGPDDQRAGAGSRRGHGAPPRRSTSSSSALCRSRATCSSTSALSPTR